MRCGIQSSTVYASLKKAIYLKDNDEFLKGEQMKALRALKIVLKDTIVLIKVSR